MKLATILLLAAPLTIAVSSCNRPHVEAVSSPPPADLTCPAEPDIAKMLAADPSGVSFDAAVRSAGQACRDALHRACEWHKERGLKIDCDVSYLPQP